MSLLEFIEKYWLMGLSGIIFPTIWYTLKATFAQKGDLDHERRRITTLENRVDGMPSAKDFHSLSEKIIGIAGDIKAINNDMVHVKKNVDMLVETEMKRGKS